MKKLRELLDEVKRNSIRTISRFKRPEEYQLKRFSNTKTSFKTHSNQNDKSHR